MRLAERHLVARIGWLRTAVLGANDGILSTASLILGVAAAAGTRPAIVIAAIASAVSFALGAALPLLIVILVPMRWLIATETIGALLFLALLGAIGGAAGGANVWRSATRVTFWGALALAVTAGIGRLVGGIV